MAGLPARGPCGLCALYPSRGPGYKPVARQRACSDHDDAYRAPVSGVRLKNPIQTMVVLKTFSRSITDLRPGPAQENGRASGRARVCQYGEISVVGGSIKNKKNRSEQRLEH